MHQTVKVMRGREAGKIAQLKDDGWELTAEHRGPLRSELTFRKVQPDSAFAKAFAAFRALAPATRRRVAMGVGGLVAALLVVIVLAVALSGGDDVPEPAAAPKKSSAPKPKPSEKASPSDESSPAPSETPSPTAPPVPDVITADNTPEFAALLKGDDCSGEYAAFSKKYRGHVIAFDGSVVAVAPHDNYDTRFDYLLGPGDDGPNTTSGPQFRYENVNYYDFGLTGKNQPESLDVGDLFRFTAAVGKYNGETCLFALSPVETTAR